MKEIKLLRKVVFTLLGVLFATSAFAIPKGPCDVKDACCDEATPGPFAFSYPEDIDLACPRDFYVHGDFLLMKPTEEGLEYAMEQDTLTVGPPPAGGQFPLSVGKVKGFSSGSQEWDWRPGFRIGVGFYTNHDAWNFDFNWTYFRIKADSVVDNGGAGTLLPLWLAPNAGSLNIPHASSRWSGDANTFDMMIGKSYHVSRYFVSNPMFGVRAAWIDQDYHIKYFINEIKRNIYLKNDYWAVGLRSFYEGHFLLGSGWYIWGKAAFALLFGKFDISQDTDTTDQVDSFYRFEYKLEDSFYCVQPNAELGLGLAVSKFYHQEQYKVSLKVGYEFHQWWDQNQARRFFDTDPSATDTVSRGDLSFNGFMFSLDIDF